MNYSIIWGNKSVCIDYFGAIDNKDIESAHFALNGDERFYECRSLILDISKCNMDQVVVDDLLRVVGTDLGASATIKTLKVAMIAVHPQNIHKASLYIESCQISPWEFRLFNSMNEAREWIDS